MVDVLCITCNVGGLLKHVSVVSEAARSALVNELGATIRRCDPAFVAIHFQECISPLEVIKPILAHPSIGTYAAKHTLLDSTLQTGLCSLFLYCPSRVDATLVELDDSPEPITPSFGMEDVLSIPTSHSLMAPLPKKVLPHPGVYQQKGFMYACWALNGRRWGFVNLHFPHETNNLESLQQTPSMVAQNRAVAVQWVLAKCAPAVTERLLLFGDFNFRPSLRGLLHQLFQARLPGPGPATAPIPDGTDEAVEAPARRLAFKWEVAEANAAMGRHGGALEATRFSGGHLADLFGRPATSNPLWVHDEGFCLSSGLQEPPVTFPPTYGYAGSHEGHVIWSKKRCPAWTDRILMTTQAARALTVREYDAVGAHNDAIKDHKPVYLYVTGA